jgi:MYXO-CTERM domain-containing protein
MKLKLIAATALIAASSHSSAAIYYVSNLVTGGGSSEALYQSAGLANAPLLDGGIIALGYFPSNAYVPSSSLANIGTTISDFTIVASALAGSASAQLAGPGAPGYVDAAMVDTAGIPSNSPLVGRALYVFAGSASTLGTSTAWALKQVATYADDEAAENEYFANPKGGAAPVIGTIGSFTGNPLPDLGAGTTTFSTLQLVAVPEPSAALLGALGALGLLRRRRN